MAPLGGRSETPWPPRTSRVGQNLFGHSGHPVSSRRTAGAFHVSRLGFRHPLAAPRAARRVIRASWHSRAFSFRGLIRRTVQHANGAAAPDGLMRSCHRGARLICTVGAVGAAIPPSWRTSPSRPSSASEMSIHSSWTSIPTNMRRCSTTCLPRCVTRHPHRRRVTHDHNVRQVSRLMVYSHTV